MKSLKMGIEAPFGMQQGPAVNSNTVYCLQKKKMQQLNMPCVLCIVMTPIKS